MLITHETTLSVDEKPVLFPDAFLCPMCGSIGHLGQAGFLSTERPAWFRCASCEYVFAFERPRPVIVAEHYHES